MICLTFLCSNSFTYRPSVRPLCRQCVGSCDTYIHNVLSAFCVEHSQFGHTQHTYQTRAQSPSIGISELLYFLTNFTLRLLHWRGGGGMVATAKLCGIPKNEWVFRVVRVCLVCVAAERQVHHAFFDIFLYLIVRRERALTFSKFLQSSSIQPSLCEPQATYMFTVFFAFRVQFLFCYCFCCCRSVNVLRFFIVRILANDCWCRCWVIVKSFSTK